MTTIDDRADDDLGPLPDHAMPGKKLSIWHRLYHGETNFNFVGRRRIGFGISAALILITLVSLFTRGLNMGIDFEGGVSWEFPANGVSSEQAQSILGDHGVSVQDAKIQTVSGTEGDSLRIQTGDQPTNVQNAVRDDFASAAKINADDVTVNTVSPTWGSKISRKAITALIVFFVILGIYISWRFEWKMAIAALIAMAHDVLISVGVYSVFGFEVTPATVIAFLTILGFSLYDTIVVFDKVLDNTKRFGTRVGYGDIVNLSMNQTLMRSLNTSFAAVLPVLSVLVIGGGVMGAVALEDFSLALLVGLIAGSYSSIFVATPVLAIWKEREPKYREHRGRLMGPAELNLLRLGETPARPSARRAAPAVAGAGAGTGATTATEVKRVDATTALTHPPRPRKKQRR
jgi:preprotein translocase subunit SecF